MGEIWLAAGLLLTAVAWFAVIPRWRLGLELFILFTPFAGLIEARLYPAPWAVLIKDILFAIPAYIGFATSGELGSALAGIPRSVGAVILLFVGLVLVQTLNPSGPGPLATLIGLKVWLFYVPMILLGRAYVRDRASLLRLSRLMTGLIWIPCSVGILQWLLSLTIGYERAISLFYGAAASAATQNFSRFDNGLMRIPATFAFPAQYLGYILCMFVPVLGCADAETDMPWRKLRSLSLLALCVAGFLTGTRATFVMIPLMLVAFYALRRGALGVFWAGAMIAALLTVALSIGGIDPAGLASMEAVLSENYAQSQAYEIGDALRETWIGKGVGSSTGAARLATDDPSQFVGFEGFYAKAVAELGIEGAFIATAAQVALLLLALRARKDLAGTDLKPYCDTLAALAAVVLIYNYKGPVMSLDPMNSLYWLFFGLLCSLHRAVPTRAADNAAATQLEADHHGAALVAVGHNRLIPWRHRERHAPATLERSPSATRPAPGICLG
ncbi:MAG TPA: hypothetical protein VKV28_10740 [Candidatus Binataceae bacterium]|nr:hypothetical protein [Candidatus Binataceae bacterium]